MAGSEPYDPWTPHWLEPYASGQADGSAIASLFDGVHPDDQIHHDTQIPLVPGVGIPEHLFPQQPLEGEPDPTAPSEAAEQPPPAPVPQWPAESGKPDAVSGGGILPPTVQDLVGGGPGAIASAPRIETHAEQYSGDPTANPVEDERNAAMVKMALEDPIGFQALQIKHAQAAEHDLATAQLKASENDRFLAEQDLKNRQTAEAETSKKMDALNAQVSDLMSRKIDPDRYMSNRSSGRRILDLIGGIAGGVAAGQVPGGNGVNRYLELIQHHIDQDIDAQKSDIENARQGIGMKRGILAEEYARTGNLYQAAEAVRIASYASVRNDILTQQQLRDPAGTQSIALGRAAQDMASRMSQAQATQAQQLFKNGLELAKEKREGALAYSTIDKNSAEADKIRGATGTGKAKDRPFPMPIQAWYAKNGITTDGQDARAAYAQYAANELRKQAVWDKTPTATTATTGGVTARAPGATSAGGAAPAHAGVKAKPAPAAEPAVQAPRKFNSEDDWFETNAPAASDQEKKRFWFVDGDSGNNVPPVKLSAAAEADKFLDRQRIMQKMGVKADQLRILTERLQKKGLWSTVKNRVNWAQDDDAMEARSLAEELTGDAITAKGMGVPSGNDVERIKTMIGGDPAGWRDPTPALQRARESMQIDQDADWKANAPAAFKDERYNKFRVLPTADPAWSAKFAHRGEIKIIGPEYGTTDPKQLAQHPVGSKKDAPDVPAAQATAESNRNLATASKYLEDSGAVEPGEPIGSDLITGHASSHAVPTAQVEDFPFKGPPEAAEGFKKLRSLHVSNVAVLERYIVSKKPGDWTAFEKGEKLTRDALADVFNGHPGLFSRYVPKDKVMAWDRDPELVAKIAGQVLRDGGL